MSALNRAQAAFTLACCRADERVGPAPLIVAGMPVYGVCKCEFPSLEEAEANAIEWARDQGVQLAL